MNARRIVILFLLLSFAAGCGDGGGGGGAPVVSPSPSSGRLLNMTYESGTANDGESNIELQGYAAYSCTADSNYKRTGAYSIRYELYDSDGMVYSGTRAESSALAKTDCLYGEGTEAYYGFSVYIPADWQNDQGNEDIIFQWKHTGGGRPDAFIAIKRTGFVLRIDNDTTITLQYTIADFTAGSWNDIVVYHKWSAGSTGHTIVWYKSAAAASYSKLVDYSGANMFTPANDGSVGYLKWGLYCPKWNDAGTTLVSHRVIYHDNIRVATTFDLADPSR